MHKTTILSSLWSEPWLIILAIALLLVLLYFISVFRTRQLAQSKQHLEDTVRERTLELQKKHDELEKLSIVAREISDGVLIMEPSGKILWVNEAFYNMAGFTKEEFEMSEYGKARTIQELSNREDIDDIVRGINEKQEAVSYDSTHSTRNKEVVWTKTTLNPIMNDKGKLEKIVGVYSNITERKHMENALRKSNRNLKDSITYAKQIQEAILPSPAKLYRVFDDSFVFYRPKDIVSGDFYWFSHIDNVLVVAAVDCTGHGVPGAFMSMIGNEFLHQVVNDSFISGPDEALVILDKMVNRALHQRGDKGESKDGMDLGMCVIHLDKLWCQFAGAMNPLYLIRDGELIEFDSVKESIGGYSDNEKQFISHEFTLKKGDLVYLFSDGYIDQFGGDKGKKFLRTRFQDLLLSMKDKPMTEQNEILNETIDNWMGDRDQLDDMLIIGFRVSEPGVLRQEPNRPELS